MMKKVTIPERVCSMGTRIKVRGGYARAGATRIRGRFSTSAVSVREMVIAMVLKEIESCTSGSAQDMFEEYVLQITLWTSTLPHGVSKIPHDVSAVGAKPHTPCVRSPLDTQATNDARVTTVDSETTSNSNPVATVPHSSECVSTSNKNNNNNERDTKNECDNNNDNNTSTNTDNNSDNNNDHVNNANASRDQKGSDTDPIVLTSVDDDDDDDDNIDNDDDDDDEDRTTSTNLPLSTVAMSQVKQTYTPIQHPLTSKEVLESAMFSLEVTQLCDWLDHEMFVEEAGILRAISDNDNDNDNDSNNNTTTTIGVPSSSEAPKTTVDEKLNLIVIDESATDTVANTTCSNTTERCINGIPRLAASRVALLTGYGHAFAIDDYPQIFTQYVYQDDYGGLNRDASLLDLDVVSEDQILAEIVSKMDEKNSVSVVNTMIETTSAELKTRTDVQTALARNRNAVEVVLASKQITNEEASILKKQTRSAANTTYGIRHEDDALAMYEKKLGVTVTGSNEKRYNLVLRDSDTDGVPAGYIVGYVDGLCDHIETDLDGHENHTTNNNNNNNNSSNTTTNTNGTTTTTITNNNNNNNNNNNDPHTGDDDDDDDAGDDDDDADDDGWTLVPCVVEIKNRVGAPRNTQPPFYDQIQCVIYMMMCDCSRCDLVEVFRENKDIETIINITRVELTGAPHHGDHWQKTLKPRCIEVCKAISNVRRDDHLRYTWLYALASGDKKRMWKLLNEWLPFLN